MLNFKLVSCVTIALVSLVFYSEPANAVGQNITICSIDSNGRGSDRTLNGTSGVDLRAKLLNASNFNPATGIEPITFSIVDGFGARDSITVASLQSNGCEVFFKGFVPDNQISQNERTAMEDWMDGTGGTLLAFAEDNQSNAFAFKLGHSTTESTATSWTATITGITHPIFNGPFGTATVLNTANDKTYYNNTTGATILATDTANTSQATIIERVVGNGHAILLGDVDVITTGISAGDGNNTDQDHFTLNLFAYAALTYNQNNYTPSTPVITAPTDGSSDNDNTPTVSGTADPGVTITVTGPNGETCTTIADVVTGAWSCEMSPALADGSNVLTTTASFGNNVSGSDTVTINVDTTAPTAPVIDPIDENTDPITGTAEPGTIINITGVVCDNAPVMTDASGNWSCEVTNSAPLIPGDEIGATATDEAGNESLPASATVGNTANQSVSPTVNPVAAGASEIIGTAVPGSIIDLAGIICSNDPVTADANGNWVCISPDPIPAVNDVINVTAIQSGLLPSAPISTTVFDPNLTAPEAPEVNPTDGDPVTGVTIPNGEITVLDIDGNILCTTTADASGNFSCSPVIPAPVDGDVLSVIVTDDNGNSSLPTQVIVDNSAPEAPIVTSPTDGDVINDNTPTVTGTAEPGAAVTVTGPNGETCSATADENGDWSCEISPALADGDNNLNVIATDPAGNPSPPTVVPVDVDTQAPNAPVINAPTNGAPVTGTGEPGATVTVTTPSGATCTAVVQVDGTWSCTLSPTPQDGEDVSATQEDEAGNTSPPTVVPGGIDTTAPAAPVCTVTPDPANDGTVVTATCTGVETDATITIPGYVCGVESGNEVVCTATVGQNDVDGDEEATIADAAGNTATVPADFTLDNEAPTEPTIDDPSTGLTVSGTGEPGATVTVTTPSGATCTAEVQNDGSWSCDLSPEPVDGEIATATQTDSAGNESDPSSTTVAYIPDLSSFITNCVAGVRPDETLLYEVNIMNMGNIDITGAQVTTLLGDRMGEPSWVCQATGGATCDNTAGNGDLNELVNLPASSALIYLFDSTVTGALMEFIDVETSVTMPSGTTDVNTGDNTTFDSDLIFQFIFKDGFECALPGTIESTNIQLDSLLN